MTAAKRQPGSPSSVQRCMVTEAEILAEAERGEVVCRLYKGYSEADEEGCARDRLCNQLADAGKLRLWRVEGSRTSPFGMVSKWRKP